MHVETRGAGPALILLHGWAMHGGVFAPLIERLQTHFTLHVVDLPGHGFSHDSGIRLTLQACADAIAERLPDALWLGWSLGGLVALQAAKSRPQAMRGAVMLCASPRFVHHDTWPHGMAHSVFDTFASELKRDYRATVDRFLLLEAQGSDHMREEIRLLRDAVYMRGEPGHDVLAQGLRLLSESDLRDALGDLQVPSLWIAGRRDRLVSPEAMRAAAQLAPYSRFVQIQSGGHAPFLTHADEVAAAVMEFARTRP